MNMRANFLASLCGSKDSDNGNFGLPGDLRGLDIVSEDRIELGRSRLVIVYAVQPDAEKIHGERRYQSGWPIGSLIVKYIVDRCICVQ
jgi:hypothetical protein